jgi:HD-like signal output (HDOD) protein
MLWQLSRKKSSTKRNYHAYKSHNSRKIASKTEPFSQSTKSNNTEELVQEKVEFTLPDDFLSFDLMTSSKLSNKQQQTVSEICQSFRKPHPLVVPLTQGVFEPCELFDLIKTDAEMTAKVLTVVNSSQFALRQPITNINHAIIFLGITPVKNIALQFTMQKNAEFADKQQNEVYKKLSNASFLASSFCLLIAKEMAEENVAELSTHCLLSYLGDLAILSYQPSIAECYLNNRNLFERTKSIQNTMGINSAVIGKHLAQQWQLPNSIVAGIDHSILPLTNGMADDVFSHQQVRQTLLCYLSCRLADLVTFGDVKDISQLQEVSFEALGEVEFYYTQESIKQAGLDKINTVIADTMFKKKINNVIKQMSVK